jgi:hypothetical protein
MLTKLARSSLKQRILDQPNIKIVASKSSKLYWARADNKEARLAFSGFAVKSKKPF